MEKYKNNKIYNIEECFFKEIIVSSNNITDALRKIGYQNPRAGRSRDTLIKRITELKIDISHFDSSNRKPIETAMPLEELFANGVDRNNTYLKKVLIREKILEYKCAICGNLGIWNNKPLTLQLDHINGDSLNNEIENLRLLCPNCHTQTETFCGRNPMA